MFFLPRGLSLCDPRSPNYGEEQRRRFPYLRTFLFSLLRPLHLDVSPRHVKRGSVKVSAYECSHPGGSPVFLLNLVRPGTSLPHCPRLELPLEGRRFSTLLRHPLSASPPASLGLSFFLRCRIRLLGPGRRPASFGLCLFFALLLPLNLP